MLIGLDIGTSSVKGVLVTNDGNIVKNAHKSFSYTRLDNGGVKISADDYIATCFSAICELSKGQMIDGFCASSASGNLLLLDKDNNPLTPIFNWQDKRVTNEAREILGEMDTYEFYKKTGWPFSYKTMPLALLCYIKKHTPEKIENCGKVCMSTEYLYFRLTGKWGISTSAGTPFFLIDQKSGKYIPEILDKIGISENMLPPVMPCGSVLGTVTENAEQECGLKKDTPVILGSFDHPSAARGVGVLKEGEMLLSCGTSWVAFIPIMDRAKIENTKALIDPFLSEKGGAWGAMVSASSLSERIALYVNRYIDVSENAYKTLSSLAQQNAADGLLINITEEPDDSKFEGFTKGNIARAIMESAVRILKEKISVFESVGIKTNTAVMVGGPSENPMWRKIILEICGISVKVKHGAFAGAVGASAIAGIGVGIFENEPVAARILDKETV